MDEIDLGLTLAMNYPKNIRAYSFQQDCGKWKGVIYLITEENKQESLFEANQEQYAETECSSVASLYSYIEGLIQWVENLEIKVQKPMKLLPEVTEMYLMIPRNLALEKLDKANEKLRKAERKALRREHNVFAIKGSLDAIEHNLNVLERRKTIR